MSGAGMTELAYLSDIDAAYERRFTARVTALPPGGVVLDRTLFYPTGGGQPSDEGTLRGDGGRSVRVREVSKSGGAVLHRLDRTSGPSLQLEETVVGEIDWERRYAHMRMHTAQHLVSAILFARAGVRTQRASMTTSLGRIDLERAWPGSVPWSEIEAEITAAIRPSRRVRARVAPRAEYESTPAARSGLVPLPAAIDQVRVIEIEGLDSCPCGGTHVRSTGEIHEIRFRGTTDGAPTGTRIEFTLSAVDPPIPGG
jgi:misacylated tRNA(Ala) deacylase